MSKRLIERVNAPLAGCRIDRAAGIIFGVKLCGNVSENGREYPAAMFQRDHRKYNGATINFNHDRSGDRRVEDVGGRIKNPRVDALGIPRGDAHLLKSHPMYERVMEAAEKDASLFGFSHVAMCETTRAGSGRERIESITSIESVDLVALPASTKGLFESKESAQKNALTEDESRAVFNLKPKAVAPPSEPNPLNRFLESIAARPAKPQPQPHFTKSRSDGLQSFMEAITAR